MILALNAGNTYISLGLFDDGRLAFSACISVAANRTKYELAVSVKNIFALYGYSTESITGIIMSCAAPFLQTLVTDAAEILCGTQPMIVGPGIKTGLNIIIDDPAQLGSDIVATSVAAISKYPKPLIVIRLGTAIVISAINANAQHIGCALAPGIDVSFETLSRQSAQLPHTRIQKPERAIGRNTVEALQAGTFFGAAAMLDGMIEKFEYEMKTKCSVVITGGRAQELATVMRTKAVYDHALLLEGLYFLYQKNSKQ